MTNLYKAILVVLFSFCSVYTYAQRTASIGAAQIFNNSSSAVVHTAKVDENHIVVFYKNGINSSASDLYARVGEVDTAAQTISWGTAALIEAEINLRSALIELNSTQVVVAYERTVSANDTGFARVLTINTSTNSISNVGNATAFHQGDVHAASGFTPVTMCRLSDTRIALCFRDEVSDETQVKIGTISGSTISFGSGQVFDNGAVHNFWIDALSSTKIVISYEDDDDSDQGKAIIGIISGNTVSYGSKYTFDSNAVQHTSVKSLGSDKFVIGYTDDGANLGYAIVGTAAGTVISYGTKSLFGATDGSSGPRDLTVCYAYGPTSSDTEVAFAYNNGTTDPSRLVIAEVVGTTVTLTRQDFLSTEADDSWICNLNANTLVIGYVNDANASDLGEAKVVRLTPSMVAPCSGTPADQDFNSTTDNTYPSSITLDCILYAPSDGDVGIDDADGGGISDSPIFSGNALLMYNNTSGGYGEFGSTDQSNNFKLDSLIADFFSHANGNVSEVYNLVGYDDGSEVVRADGFDVTSSGTYGTGGAAIVWDRDPFNASNNNSGFIYFGAGWSNIDKLRFEVADTAPFNWMYIALDDINFEDASACSMTASITAQSNASCPAGTDGFVTVTQSDGTANFKYQWSNGDSTVNSASSTNTITGLAAGTYTVTVTDNNGCTVTASATITGVDNTDPVAICQNITVYLNGSGSATVFPNDVNNGSTDNCGIGGLASSPAVFNCANVGANTVTLTVTDNSGNTDTCHATVTIVDSVSPVAVCQNITVYLDGAGNATITAADIDGGSTDNCSISSYSASQTSFTCANIGANAVTLTVTDGSGNTDNCSATVTVVDSVSPVAVCQNITVFLDGSGNATITAADIDGGSTDNCSISSYSASQTSFTCANIGANSVTLTVTDGSGNTDNCSATVTVADTTSPVAVCQNLTVYLNSAGTASITGADIDAGSSDNCSINSYSASPSSFTCADIGANSVTLTVTDPSGNSSNCSATVTIVDSISTPRITLTVDVDSNLTAPGATDGGLTANASGGATPYTYLWSNAATTASITGLAAGTYTVTVTDQNGCSESQSGVVGVSAGALNFDGGSDYVSAGTFSMGNAWTLEGWVYFDNLASHRHLFGKYNQGFVWYETGVGLRVEFRDAADANWRGIPQDGGTAPTLSTNTWYHVAATFGGTGTTLKLYVNGTLMAESGTINTNPLSTGGYNFTLGRWEGFADRYLDGVMDEVRVWDHARTSCELNTYKDCQITGSESGLLAYYQFTHGIAEQDNTGETSLTDVSGNSNTGTLSGFALSGTSSNWVLQSDSVSGTCVTPAALSVSINTDNAVSCSGGTDGQLTANPTGGTPAYNYNWSSGPATQTIGSLSAGTYTVTVTDAKTCTTTNSTNIPNPAGVTGGTVNVGP